MSGATESLHRAHIADLRSALAAGGKQLPTEVVEQCERMLGALENRLDLGVDHTIVALAGGTGSGKSSTFNALSGLEFADVGVKRPTTARVNACSWSTDATDLLDWLEVDTDRRITRNTALDGALEQELHGLILLDLPDHDSIVEQHKDVVDAILPLVDLLIWIVDPQKYADQALHAGYLRKLVDAQASMVVAINQIDKVSGSARDLLVVDVEQMLIADGLGQVVVRAISARTGEGIDELRAELKGAVARQSMASVRMRDELARLAQLILEHVPSSVITDPQPLLEREVDKILVASGITGVSDQVAAAQITQAWAGEAPVITSAGQNQVAALRERWLQTITANMTDRWAAEVIGAVTQPGELTVELTKAFAKVPIPWQKSQPVQQAKNIAYGCWAGAVVLAVLAVLGFSGVGPAVMGPVGGVGALIGAVGGWIYWRLAASRARKWGADSAHGVRLAARNAVRGVLEQHYSRPLLDILGRHERVRSQAHNVSEAK